MEETPKAKRKPSIKLLNLPQVNMNERIASPRSGLSPRPESPKSPRKISPTTEARLQDLAQREALPRRFSNPTAMTIEEKK